MWRTIERYTPAADKDDYYWVVWFVEAVAKARHFPKYYYKTKQERKELAQDIQKLTKKLTSLYQNSGLDAHLYHSRLDPDLKGFYIYEDLLPFYQETPEGWGHKLSFTAVLKFMEKRSIAVISDAEDKWNNRGSIEAKWFMRGLSNYNKRIYGKPLHEVVATAVYAVYGLYYADVSVLLNRRTPQT